MNPAKRILAALGRGLRVLSPTCREATRLQSTAMDGELTGAQKFGLKVHVFLCRWCRRYGRQLRFMRRAIHTQSVKLTDAPTHGLSADARARIKRSISGGSK